MNKLHPRQALVQLGTTLPVLPSCVHYAGSEKLMLKSFAIQDEKHFQFDVCCDLEDGAACGGERRQLELVAKLLASRAGKKRAGVRLHDFSSGLWIEEIELLLPAVGKSLAFITIPKVKNCLELMQVVGVLRDHCRAQKILCPPLHVLIETHGALRDVWQIATVPEVQGLEFGIMDFVSEHHGAIPLDCIAGPGQFDNRLIARAKTEIVAAALANGCIPVHNVTLDIKNPQASADDAVRAKKEFGFLRMWSIHPSQIEPIVNAMRPDFAAVEIAAAALVKGYDQDWAPIDLNGQLVDRASYRIYWNLLQQAKIHGVKIPREAEKLFF